MNEAITGTIIKVFGLYYTVEMSDGEVVDCFLKGKNRIKKKFRQYTSPCAVGDVVSVQKNEDGSGSIIDVFDRKNCFSRKSKGRNSREDVIAANIDSILIIQSYMDPIANPRFVDRLAVRAYKEGITPILCMNKVDLASDEMIDFLKEYYENSGLPFVHTSTKTREGLDELKELIEGKRTLLAGYSGVGKSSLINALYDFRLPTSETSEKTGKGRHTTTNVFMHKVDPVTELLDSPGVREFGLMDIEPGELSDYFYEYRHYRSRCAFADCSHEHEPGCYIKKLVEDGELCEERYVSYLQMLEQLHANRDEMYR